jgi:ABC-2 type transport system permease protein
MHAKLIRLRAQIVKELLCLLRDPKSRAVMIGPPLIQLLLFSFAITLEVKNVDVALLNHDTGGAAIELVQQIDSSALVKRIRVAGSERELAEMIDTQQVLAGVVIPETFSRDIAQGKSGTAQVIIDGRKVQPQPDLPLVRRAQPRRHHRDPGRTDGYRAVDRART